MQKAAKRRKKQESKRKEEGGTEGEKEVSATEDLMREHGVLRRTLIVYAESAKSLRFQRSQIDPSALMYADAAGAEPGLNLSTCVTCWRQAQLLRRWPGVGSSGRSKPQPGFFRGIDELSPFVSVDLFSGLPSRQRQTQLARKASPAWPRNTRLGLLFYGSRNADGHPKVAVKLAAEDLLQVSTPRPPGHVAHEHPLPSPRRPRPLPAAREVGEHAKESDIDEHAAVVVVPEDDHALLVAGKMNVLEVGGLEVDGLEVGDGDGDGISGWLAKLYGDRRKRLYPPYTNFVALTSRLRLSDRSGARVVVGGAGTNPFPQLLARPGGLPSPTPGYHGWGFGS
jgi:hypothetical protein